MVNGTFLSMLARAAGVFALGLVISAPAVGAPARPVHLTAELVADHAAVAPGGSIHVALRQKIEDGWHTYWRNPGDSGQATTLAWSLPAGWRAGAIVWPTPERLKTGPLIDYGYTGEVLLPVELTAPPTVRPGQTATLKAHAAFLVCKDICVPTDADLVLDLPVVAAAPPADAHWGPRIAAALAAAPRPSAALRAAMTPGAAALRLSVTGAPLTGADIAQAYFYPYDGESIAAAGAQTIERGPGGLTLSLVPGSAFKTGPAPASLAGVLALGDRAFELTAPSGPPLPGAAGLGPPPGAAAASASLGRFAAAIGLAFLGGLILNLMPCVFPVLAMKAAALASHGRQPRAARLQGLAYLAGVVGAFLALAAALIAARAAGEAVGWGFQLQSPPVLAGLALVMLLVALNLSGVFEAGASLQAAAGELDAKDDDGAAGALLTGVLAVAVAAPCTAPFMGPAIGFALTQGPAIALAVFLALALGMAAPFVVLVFAPGLIRLAPRPGAWMEGLRKALAFPMYATAAWLAWVYAESAGTGRLASLFAAAVLTGLAAWLYGAGQRAGAAGRRAASALAASGLAAALALAVAFWPAGASLAPQTFTPERLALLRAEHKPVFVNFTAAWCVTCQVNERVALSGPTVADAFAKAGVVYLEGDWTDRDAMIEQALADHGRAGVPLYLMYPADGGEPQVLPQILTEGEVIDAARRAAGA